VNLSPESLAIIERVATRLARKFVFGYFTLQDMKQEARLIALQGMKSYDGVRPLENFLYKHVKNRLINFKRDNYKRSHCACMECGEAFKEGLTPPHTNENGEPIFCDVFKRWHKRNISKQNIVEPLDISNINDEKEPRMRLYDYAFNECVANEMIERIDMALPTEYRATYLQLREGLVVPKLRRSEVQREIRRILMRCNDE